MSALCRYSWLDEDGVASGAIAVSGGAVYLRRRAHSDGGARPPGSKYDNGLAHLADDA